MTGLDQGLKEELLKDRALGRVRSDINSDFIFSPHYKLVFDRMGDELWDNLMTSLRNGTYSPGALVISEVPKPSGLTRPGALPEPLDRLLFQALADYMAPILDPELDGNRVYSYHIRDPDPSFSMFERRAEGYQNLRHAINTWVTDQAGTHVITTDITSCYSRINHHSLENLLTSSGVPDGIVRILVKTILESWSGRFSYGIPQGLFPSDLIGNYYLTSLDTFFEVSGFPFVRYVDDIYALHPDEHSAKASLSPLCRYLRELGLDLNESKTRILEVGELDREETELDRLFEEAREEVYGELAGGNKSSMVTGSRMCGSQNMNYRKLRRRSTPLH